MVIENASVKEHLIALVLSSISKCTLIEKDFIEIELRHDEQNNDYYFRIKVLTECNMYRYLQPFFSNLKFTSNSASFNLKLNDLPLLLKLKV